MMMQYMLVSWTPEPIITNPVVLRKWVAAFCRSEIFGGDQSSSLNRPWSRSDRFGTVPDDLSCLPNGIGNLITQEFP